MAKTIKIVGAGISQETANDLISRALEQAKADMRLEILKAENPVGHVRIELTNTNPATYLGFGTWELWGVGQVPIGVDPSNSAISTANQSIGSNSVTVTSASTTPGATGKATGNTDATTPDNTGAYSGTTGAATGNTDSTTPGNTGSTTPDNTGAATGSTGSTTPSATGAATGDTGSTALTTAQMPGHYHDQYVVEKDSSSTEKLNIDYNYWDYGKKVYQTKTEWIGSGQGHTHTLGGHTHTSAAHSHTLNNHTHTSAAHTHTSAAHSHGLGSHTHSIPSHTHSSAAHSHGLGSHTHTSAAHSHSVTISTIQSSVSCYMWRRVA